MADLTTIRSAANPALKQVRAVAAGKERELLLLEGDRLIEEARRLGLRFELLLYGEARASAAEGAARQGLPARLVAGELLARVSRLESSPGCLALVRAPRALALAELEVDARALVLVLHAVADPGNLGALARTAEAAGARALVLAGGGCGAWNEKALRGSMGSLLRLPVVQEPDAESSARALAERGFRQVVAATRGGAPLARFDWSGPIALWMASETGALPRERARFEAVSVPMAGGVESLNVAAAAAVLLFAAGRATGGSA